MPASPIIRNMIELFFLSVMLSVMLDKVAPLKLMVLASILVVNSKIKLYKERNDIHIQGTLPDFVSVSGIRKHILIFTGSC